jgi:ubiquinone/menaquinone biosynthesis C-methylase UbiE
MEIKGFKDTIDWYDNNSEEYARSLYSVTPSESISLFLSHLPNSPKILEVGCGPGRESKIFIEKGAKVTGVDISVGLLNIAKEKNPQAEYINANFLDLPFNNSVFDGVWSHASLVHLETIMDVEKALSEFNRVLKERGILYVCVKMQMGDKKTAVVTDSLSNHDRFFRYYTKEELAFLLISAGFRIVQTNINNDDHGRQEVKWIEVVARK